MSLRVAVDARALDIPYLRGQGIGRYTAGLLDALQPVSRERGGSVTMLRAAGGAPSPFSDASPSDGSVVPVRRPRLPERLAIPAEQLLLPRDLRRAGAQVLHATSPFRAVPAPGVPWVLTLHDVIPLLFPEQYLRSGMLYRLMYATARRAALILAPSGQARQDILNELGLAPESVRVVPGAAADRFRPTPPSDALLAALGIEPPYLLYVGGLAASDPRKRVDGLIEAIAAWGAAGDRPETLVLTGRLGDASRPLRERARRIGARVRFTDFVPDQDLPALYTGAACLVTASSYEGFDLPALEALACGTPVAAFRVGAHEEVAGPGALLAEDGDMGGLIGAVERLCDDSELRERLSRAGREHASQFSWRRSAGLAWDAYEQAAGMP